MENPNQLSANQKIGLLDSITGLMQAKTHVKDEFEQIRQIPALPEHDLQELAASAMSLVRDLMQGNFKS